MVKIVFKRLFSLFQLKVSDGGNNGRLIKTTYSEG